MVHTRKFVCLAVGVEPRVLCQSSPVDDTNRGDLEFNVSLAIGPARLTVACMLGHKEMQ